jgi:hypothetical protein
LAPFQVGKEANSLNLSFWLYQCCCQLQWACRQVRVQGLLNCQWLQCSHCNPNYSPNCHPHHHSCQWTWSFPASGNKVWLSSLTFHFPLHGFNHHSFWNLCLLLNLPANPNVLQSMHYSTVRWDECYVQRSSWLWQSCWRCVQCKE